MDRKLKTYLAEFGGGLAVYIGSLAGSMYGLRHWTLAAAPRYLLALAPMVGVALCAWAIVRHVRRLDELRRRKELEALTFASVATAFGTVAWAFAETAGAPKLPTFYICPLICVLWAMGYLISCRSYR
jgi:hypothetical protein